MKKSTVYLITESGICIALATILSLIQFFRLPFGGTVTVVSMLPICLLAYRRGIKTGLMCGFTYGILQMILGITEGTFKGASLGTTIGMVVFDYILAFTILGLCGMFKGKTKSTAVSFSLGCLVVTTLRYLSHALSGFIFFSSYSNWFFSQEGFTWGASVLEKYSGTPLFLIYTFVYNGLYMIPEIIITTLIALIIGRYSKIMETAK